MAQKSLDTLVIGAGPYGVSISAHLRQSGVDHRVVGVPLDTWSTMPPGLCLRSPASASSLSDPGGKLTIEAYHAELGVPLRAPIPLESFLAYARWFMERTRVEIDQRLVRTLSQRDGGFTALLDDGESIDARRVVVAAGTEAFRWTPPEFAVLDPRVASHAGAHSDLGVFSGQDVVVLGAGQGAIEWAALAHEAGARVRVIHRSPGVRWLTRSQRLHSSVLAPVLYSPTDVGPAGLSRLVAVPSLFRQLPPALRLKATQRCARPAASAWLIERTRDVPIESGVTMRHVTSTADGVRIECADGRTITADHLLFSTGYRVDLARYEFIAAELRSRIDVAGGYPVLRRGLTTSVPGLHIVGWPSVWAYGPLMRHLCGADFTARAVTGSLLRGRSSGARGTRRRASQYHFNPATYDARAAANIPLYNELQAAVAEATRGLEVRSILDLGVGTGTTAAAVLAVHPDATLTGIDSSSPMLETARMRLPVVTQAELLVGRLEDPLPEGEFDLVISALAIHHLTGNQKRDLFSRVRRRLASGGCFVLADVVRSLRREDRVTSTSRLHDRLELADDLERWLREAGFEVSRAWSRHDLAVFRALSGAVVPRPVG